MREAAVAEQDAWIMTRGLAMRDGNVALQSLSARATGLRIPDRALDCARLAWSLVRMDQEGEQDKFAGGLAKIVHPEARTGTVEGIGRLLLDPFFGSRPTPSTAGSGHAVLFASDDQVSAAALMTVALCARYDAWFVPDSGRHVIYLSPEGYVIAIARDEETFTRLGDWLSVEPAREAPRSVMSRYL